MNPAEPKNDKDQEFFIGWEQKVPPRQKKFLYNRLIGIFTFAFLVAILLPALQIHYSQSFHYKNRLVNLEGYFTKNPLPSLLVKRPGGIGEDISSYSIYYLSYPQKRAIPLDIAETYDSQWVSLRGTLLFNQSDTMIEVQPRSISLINYYENKPPRPIIPERSLGIHELKGELLASKTYLGASNPGYGKALRAASVLHVTGGIAPMLVINLPEENTHEFILIGENNIPIEAIAPYVGTEVSIKGEVIVWGDKLVLKTNLSMISNDQS